MNSHKHRLLCKTPRGITRHTVVCVTMETALVETLIRVALEEQKITFIYNGNEILLVCTCGGLEGPWWTTRSQYGS